MFCVKLPAMRRGWKNLARRKKPAVALRIRGHLAECVPYSASAARVPSPAAMKPMSVTLPPAGIVPL